MKSNLLHTRLLVLALALLLANCATARKPAASQTEPVAIAKSAPKAIQASSTAAKAAVEEKDDYDTAEISDPFEPVNRSMFWINDQFYTFIFKPISKGYQFLFPKPVRKGIDNAIENVKYPVRFVNCALQGKLKRAGQETGKFFVNTIGGVGGIFKPSERISSLANVPAEDTAQTFATWGIGHGPYIVLPLLGPSSVRDTVGLAGDYAANPVNWPYLYFNTGDWNIAPPSANTLRSMPGQFEDYDTATKDAVDPYLSARSTYVQNRAEAAKK